MFKKVYSLYSAFYPSLHFTLSLQSAVRSLRLTLTGFLPNLSRLSFPTHGLGWLVNQRNPSGYWQVMKGDLSQIISFLHNSFLFRSSFFIRF